MNTNTVSMNFFDIADRLLQKVLNVSYRMQGLTLDNRVLQIRGFSLSAGAQYIRFEMDNGFDVAIIKLHNHNGYEVSVCKCGFIFENYHFDMDLNENL